MSTMTAAPACCFGCLWWVAILAALYGAAGAFYHWRVPIYPRWPLQRTALILGCVGFIAYLVLNSVLSATTGH